MAKVKRCTVTGILTPLAWDRLGNVISMTVSTADEQEYIIGGSSVSDELRHCLRRLVRVRGYLQDEVSEGGLPIIVPESVQVLQKAAGWSESGNGMVEDRHAVTDGDWYPVMLGGKARVTGARSRGRRAAGLKNRLDE